MSKIWFCKISGHELGPLHAHELIEFAQAGRLLRDDFVRKGIEGAWIEAHKVHGLRFQSAHTHPSIAGAASRELNPGQNDENDSACTPDTIPTSSLPAKRGPHPSPIISSAGLEPLGIDLAQASHDSVKAETRLRPGDALPISTRAYLLMACVLGPFLIPTFGGEVGAVGVWILAATSAVVGGILFWLVIDPEEDDEAAGAAICAFFISATVCIGLLFVFQEIAEALAVNMDWKNAANIARTKPGLILALVKAIGNAYGVALDPTAPHDVNFFVYLACWIISVGFCEEFVKLMPVLVFCAYVAGAEKQTSPRSLLLIGAYSGLGFGIGEAFHYHSSLYAPLHLPLSCYLTRFSGSVFSHAALTFLSTAVVISLSESIEASKTPTDKSYGTPSMFWAVLGVTVICVSIAATAHGLFDAWMAYDNVMMALVTQAAVVIAAIFIVQHWPKGIRLFRPIGCEVRV